MLYALDAEFIDDGKTLDLISLALVSEDGREFYVQNRNAQLHKADPWVKAHVLPCLDHRDCKAKQRARDVGKGVASCRAATCPWTWHDDIGIAVQRLIGDPRPSFLGYYSAYDWVVFCQLWGQMVDIPTGWPGYCLDLRQWLDNCGHPEIRQPVDTPHG